MLNIISHEVLEELMSKQNEVCVSIYMPAHTKGAEVQQDHIRFKNLIKTAEKELKNYGLKDEEISSFLAPAYKIENNGLFWRPGKQGVVAFLTKNYYKFLKLPKEFKEFVIVNNRFHLKPLLSFLRGDGDYYVLVLSQNNVKLLECSHFNVEEIQLNGSVPHSINDILKYYHAEKHIESHLGSSKLNGTTNTVYHGQQGSDELQFKPKIFEYFRHIDQGLHKVLKNSKAPMVLASVEYLMPIYREANTYPHLLPNGITGNYEHQNNEEIKCKAWSLVEGYFKKAEAEAKFQYEKLFGTSLVSYKLEEIIPAAYEGRVDKLFVTSDSQRWGTFNTETGTIEFHENKIKGDCDLLDYAAIQTYLKHGKVFVVEPNEVPNGAYLAAVMRY